MINKSNKSKKSTSKKRVFGVSPLIPIVAMIEVLVLIAISTYAWYYIQASKEVGSGTISVDADSGLDIDFQYSNVDDYINIWNYVDKETFTLEPATSMDGRMIYFPTSGTFNSVDTEDLVLRDGTVNDINSKYLCIEFELTNTSGYDQYVYLNNNSYFRSIAAADEDAYNADNTSVAYEESRALRLAFYQNDGNSGNVGSSLLNAGGSTDGGSIETQSEDAFTIYYDNSVTKWSSVYAHVYDYVDGGSQDEPYESWPGLEMTRVTGSIYSVTFNNPIIDSNAGTRKYDAVIFNNNNESRKPASNANPNHFTLNSSNNNHKFDDTGDQGLYTENTIYFLKPYGWGDTVKCYAWDTSQNAYTPGNGDDMTYVGSGIYSYSYDSSNTGGVLFNNGSMSSYNQTVDVTLNSSSNGNLYYCTGETNNSGGKNKYSVSTYSKKYTAPDFTYKTLYFYDTYGWSKPYAIATVDSDSGSNKAKADIAMTSLSGSVYYCNVPEIYNNVYFKEKENSGNSFRTIYISPPVHQTVYRPNEQFDTSGYRKLDTFIYADYIQSTGYPVISPGVSAGFQRPYSPVLEIDAESGAATKIIPAYSNSIDNYILGDTTQYLFELKSGHMASLSMIMWLEGTDDACKGDTYPGNLIDLKLEFSTKYTDSNNQVQYVNRGNTENYTYNFYDKTREIWTSDRQATESGVTVAPVMQLYDNTTKRGYLMSPTKYGYYNGKNKVSCWSVDAPQSIALLGHDIIFRRVNPYDEEEVWNYWHAGPVAGARNMSNGKFVPYTTNQTIYPVAMAGTQDTINFTAFADGSPIKEYMEKNYRKKNPSKTDADVATYLSEADMPNESCGGLWGNHKVRTLTLLDATKGHYFRTDDGIMSIKYNYIYSGGSYNPHLAIEYKASGPNYDSVYYFVVPEALFEQNRYSNLQNSNDDGNVYFKRYYNFDDGYAINSDRNDELLFDRKWNAGEAKGDYYSISQEVTNAANKTLEYVYYWGTDILYVQTNATTYTSVYTDIDKERMLQVKFFKYSNNVESNDRFVTLFDNSNFKGTQSDSQGFPVVVPSDKEYTNYRVEFANINGTSIYESSWLSLYTSSVSNSSIERRNTVYNSSANRSEHICKIDHFKNITIFFETANGDFNGSSLRKIHWFNAYNSNQFTWPGGDLTFIGNPYNDNPSVCRYSYSININDYNKFIINNGSDNIKFNEIFITPQNNYDVYWGEYQSGKYKAWKTSTNLANAYSANQKDVIDLGYASADATSWPHYSAQ